MSLFVAYQSDFSEQDADQGLKRVRDHYKPPVDSSTDAFHHEGLGAWFAWGDYDNQKAYRHSRTPDVTAFLSHIPYGYSRTISARPGDADFAEQVGRRILGDPAAIADFSAPFSTIITDRRSFIRVAVDGVGLARLYHYKTRRGTFISNRAVAAILMSGEIPGPSETGWASQLTFGYFWDDLTPFDGVKSFKAGEYAVLSKRGAQFGAVNALKTWMSEEPESMFDGFDRAVGEMQHAIALDHVLVNLSGGRDSRAMSALITAHFGDRARMKTNYPPLVERDAAYNLISRLPYFDRFDGETAAWSKDRQIWVTGERGVRATKQGLRERARLHMRQFEGSTLSTHMAGPITATPTFVSGFLMPGIGGGGGEISKAYGWAASKKAGRILKTIKEVSLEDRLPDFVLTADRSLGMLTGDRYKEIFWPMLSAARDSAADVGLTGYRFLNYHLLMTRVGRAAGLGVTDNSVPFFLGPHHISAALRQDERSMAEAKMHNRIIEHYRPEWAGLPFEGDMHSRPERRVGLPPKDYLWRGPHAREFRAILANRSSFGEPYDHDAILALYSDPSENPGVMNQRGFDLIYRAAFMEFLNALRQQVKTG